MRLELTLIASIIFAGATANSSAEAIVMDGYAAAIGRSIVTVGEVKEEMQRGNREVFRAMQAGERVSEERLAELYSQALETLVAEALIVEEFRRLEDDGKVMLPEDAVDNSIQSIINERYAGNRADLFHDLRRSGISFSDFREQQRRSLIMMIMRNQKFANRVHVSPGEVRSLYRERIDQYEIPAAVEIGLIMIDHEDTEEALLAARSIVDQIASGGDFAALAREHSIDRMAEQGGYRGWMNPQHLRPEIRAVLDGMDVDDISGLVKSGNHWYIVKLMGVRAGGFRPLVEVERELEHELRDRKMQDLMKAWVEQLKSIHYVSVYPLPDLL